MTTIGRIPDARDRDGTLRLLARRFGHMAGAVILCPDGRKVARVTTPAESHFGIECAHRIGSSLTTHSDDVHWLYVLPAIDGGVLVVECTAEEARWIKARGYGVAAVRLYLGLVATAAA